MNNEYERVPEHMRSPSPEPIYDKNGVRLNTREVLIKYSYHTIITISSINYASSMLIIKHYQCTFSF